MLSTHQLRDALRKGLFIQIKRESPIADNTVALRLARMKEKQAWKRRDDATVARLSRTVSHEALAKLESRFQEYFRKTTPPPPPATSSEVRVQ